jgi:hypothetical protein
MDILNVPFDGWDQLRSQTGISFPWSSSRDFECAEKYVNAVGTRHAHRKARSQSRLKVHAGRRPTLCWHWLKTFLPV